LARHSMLKVSGQSHARRWPFVRDFHRSRS
jgi:hypothetical protein